MGIKVNSKLIFFSQLKVKKSNLKMIFSWMNYDNAFCEMSYFKLIVFIKVKIKKVSLFRYTGAEIPRLIKETIDTAL